MIRLNPKRIILIGLIILAALSIVYLFFNVKKSTAPTKLTTPNISSRSEGEIKIVSTLKKDNISIPENISTYIFTQRSLTNDESLTIAKKIGLTNSPEQFNDANFGTTYIWSTENDYLRVVPTLRLVDYKRTNTVSSSVGFATEADLVKIAKDFLSQKTSLDTSNLIFDQIKYLSSDNNEYIFSTRDRGDVANVYFRQQINGFPIVNDTPGSGTITVGLNKDSALVSIYINDPGVLSPIKNYTTKTFDELIKALPSAKVQSIEVGNTELLSSPSNQVSNITVNTVKIAYLKEYSPIQTVMQPVFVLVGDAQLASGQTAIATLYLPAISESEFNK